MIPFQSSLSEPVDFLGLRTGAWVSTRQLNLHRLPLLILMDELSQPHLFPSGALQTTQSLCISLAS